MGLMFFPRGGSSQVARYLARSLPESGWDCTLACGSLGPPGRAVERGHLLLRARRARAGLRRRRPRRPIRMAAEPPYHPSFEDRPGAPDRVFARLDDARVRAPGGHLAPAPRGGRGGGGGPPSPASPDPAERGRRAGVPRRAPDRPPPRHRAADAARDRRGAAPAAGTTRGSGPTGCGAGPRAASGCWCSHRTPCGACPGCWACPRSGWCGLRTASSPRAFSAQPRGGRRAPGALAALARGGAARLGRVGGARERGLLGGGPRALPRRRARAPVRGEVHVGEAHPAPDPRARPRAGALRAPRAARAPRRLPGRVGGRAPAVGDPRDRRPRTCSWPAGAATRTSPRA